MDTERLNGSERAEKDAKTERRTNTVSTRDAPPSPHGRDPGKKKVHRRKPWSLGERLRNLTPDFMDVRRRNCSIAR
ncbi:hypothetical protein, partial [Burkholderia pseudomallei]|uniref:hypothetical protein n=1 Tax=Burkholderia pseudomallei TaxID=28450 RepID=UPI001F1D7CB0